MEMHQVRYFLATCETLNFTKAAEFSNVSQPALTKAVRMLEEELGGELFDRQSRPLQLTDLGQLLKERFAAIWDTATEIKIRSKQFNRLEDSSFTLGVINTIGEDRLIKLKDQIQNLLPGVTILIKHANEALLLSELKDGVLELAVVTDSPSLNGRFNSISLYAERYVLAGSSGNAIFQKKNISLGDVDGQEYIYRLHCEKNTHVDDLLHQKNLKVRSILITDQDELARRMVSSGAGVTIMPESMATAPVTSRNFADVDIKRNIQVTSLASRLLSPVATKVLDALIEAHSNHITHKNVMERKIDAKISK